MTWLIETRDEAHAAGEAARVVLDAFVRAGGRDFGLALSGGRVAPLFFAGLVREATRRGSPFGEADFFWADERCVPPDHVDSNYRVARAALLEPLAVPRERIHRLEGERDPAEAAARAVDDWSRWCDARTAGRARLDGVILGVGEDGHVASLFPGNLAVDLESPAPYRTVIGPKPPPARLTLGYPMLWRAGLVMVLAPGEGKREVVQRSVSGAVDTPLSRVLRGREGRGGETVLITSGR